MLKGNYRIQTLMLMDIDVKKKFCLYTIHFLAPTALNGYLDVVFAFTSGMPTDATDGAAKQISIS